MRRFTVAGGMALVWRLTTRRAGRRTLATMAGVAVLWVVAVLLLPTVLPPALHTASQALPPAHRRIHQQQPDADYTGLKQGGLGRPGTAKKTEEETHGAHKGGNGGQPNNHDIQESFPMKERGQSVTDNSINARNENEKLSPNFLESVIHFPHEPNLIDKILNNNNKNLVFAPIKPNYISESGKGDLYSELNVKSDAGAPIYGSEDRPRNGHEPAIAADDIRVDQSANEKRHLPADPGTNTALGMPNPVNADNNSNTAGEVDRPPEMSNAAEEPDTPKQNNADGKNSSYNEGPYTLPILKAPKEGSSPPKRGGYLSRLPMGHHPLLDPPTDQEDVGEGSIQPVVPFKVAKGAFRGVGGVFPIHPVEFQHPGGMMGEVFKSGVSDPQEQAQILAMAAVQHGHRITQKQRDMVDKLSPDRRKRLEIRAKELRLKQERAYLLQLRDRKQIAPTDGGGEKVISTARVTVRFPTSLKKMQPEDWPPEYRVYLNISHSPWPPSSPCSPLVTTFARPHSLPTRAIASFPSSGNTWARYLMEGATGIYTGSLYDDSSLTRKGMYGEAVPYDSGMTLLQKTHGYTTGEAMKKDHAIQMEQNHFREVGCRGVVVVRNPFKALISHRHLDIGGHTGYAPKSQFQGHGWAEFVELKIKLWESFYIDWLEQCPSDDIFITHYEILKSNLKTELTNILNFLHVPVDEFRVSCVHRHSDGLFKRKPSKNVPYNIGYYPRALKDKIYAAIDRLNTVLKSKGKDELPITMYEMYDATEAKVAREQRHGGQ